MYRREPKRSTHLRADERTKFSPEHIELLHLEVEAMMALAGLRKNPEQVIAALLEHPADLHPELRFRIAEALRGAGSGISLVARGQSKTGWARSWLEKQASITRARRVKDLQKAGAFYEDAIETVASESRKGKKTVEADVALANRTSSWVEKKLAERNDSYETDPQLMWPTVLTTIYLQADAKKLDPDEYLQGKYNLHGGPITSPHKLMRSLYPEITKPQA